MHRNHADSLTDDCELTYHVIKVLNTNLGLAQSTVSQYWAVCNVRLQPTLGQTKSYLEKATPNKWRIPSKL